jgi:hypothetical protein
MFLFQGTKNTLCCNLTARIQPPSLKPTIPFLLPLLDLLSVHQSVIVSIQGLSLTVLSQMEHKMCQVLVCIATSLVCELFLRLREVGVGSIQ